MKPKMYPVQVSQLIPLSPHLLRIVVKGSSLKSFPESKEGAHVKVILPNSDGSKPKMRSYTIRWFNSASQAKLGEHLSIAGPGQLKLTQFNHHSYLLLGDITSVNAINGYVPRLNPQADLRVIISVPTRADIIELDYHAAENTHWYVEDEATISFAEQVQTIAAGMASDSHIFMGLEASQIRSLRPMLQQDLGFDRLNTFAVGYWKQGVDADRFGAQKKAAPL
ncbi:siderophore-interacting protein [Agarivorans sp. B2Z047]|uniref:siderophore-interacting protein n=1 Tax=Agarivorans sp. B2Z047 TaxID=2652721 RepID=UPI00128DC84B|nr:siderophore-interacting protein [Agarivorans sp. B2Z047]MPW29058.1 siderophore-interacting protein [Agarivorans sp. B2Z047]UQN41611.1 siderophore-interacting protein [Agarivorans sp. B2Z047]